MDDARERLRQRQEQAKAKGAQEQASRNSAEGFVKVEHEGQYVEGYILDFWATDENEVVTIEVLDITAPVFTKADTGGREQVDIVVGDHVYVGLGAADLRGKLIAEQHKEHFVLIGFMGLKPLRSGHSMKRFIVQTWSAEKAA